MLNTVSIKNFWAKIELDKVLLKNQLKTIVEKNGLQNKR